MLIDALISLYLDYNLLIALSADLLRSQFVCLFTIIFAHSFNYFLIYLFTYLFIYSFIYASIHLLVYPNILRLINSKVDRYGEREKESDSVKRERHEFSM